MPPTRTARSRVIVPAALVAVAGLVAVPIVVHASKDSPVATANAADSTVTALPNVGRVETCVLDASSGCTVLHGFGQKPVAITATASGPAMVSIDPRRTTDKSYRLRALRYDGKNYTTGTKLTYTVHYDFAAVAETRTLSAASAAGASDVSRVPRRRAVPGPWRKVPGSPGSAGSPRYSDFPAGWGSRRHAPRNRPGCCHCCHRTRR